MYIYVWLYMYICTLYIWLPGPAANDSEQWALLFCLFMCISLLELWHSLTLSNEREQWAYVWSFGLIMIWSNLIPDLLPALHRGCGGQLVLLDLHSQQHRFQVCCEGIEPRCQGQCCHTSNIALWAIEIKERKICKSKWLDFTHFSTNYYFFGLYCCETANI